MNFIRTLFKVVPRRGSPFLAGRWITRRDKRPMVPENAWRPDLYDDIYPPDKKAFEERGYIDEKPAADDCEEQDYIEEEDGLDDFMTNRFYPVNLGDVYFNIEDISIAEMPNVYAAGHQVLEKFGFGNNSTSWLARNLKTHDLVTLKIFREHAPPALGKFREAALPTNSLYREGLQGYDVFTQNAVSQSQIDGRHRREHQPWSQDATPRTKILDRLKAGRDRHWGKQFLKIPSEEFSLTSDGRRHHCHVHELLGQSWRQVALKSSFHEQTLKAGLMYILLALDYLHTECRVIHTNLTSDSVFESIGDDDHIEWIYWDGSASCGDRDLVNGHPVYESSFGQYLSDEGAGCPGPPILCDLGFAVPGDQANNHDVQTDAYKAPEVILGADWSYPIDIWNLGVMIWDLLDPKGLFHGLHGSPYSTRTHVQEMIHLLGAPAPDLVQRGRRLRDYFVTKGQTATDIVPTSRQLADRLPDWEGRQLFADFVCGMLQWRPENRMTARALLFHPWMRPMTRRVGRWKIWVSDRWELDRWKKMSEQRCMVDAGARCGAPQSSEP